MRTTQVIKHFRGMRPDLVIADGVVDGGRRLAFMVKKGDAVHAIAGDPCQCTIARGCRRETNAAEALILTNVAYLLEPAGRKRYRVAKHLHNGENVVKNTDAGGYPVWNTHITLRPPSAMRRVGVQTLSQKAAQPKKQRQTREHVARRAASLRANPARSRLSMVGTA